MILQIDVMIYLKFNRYIKIRFFRPENIGYHVVISVDEQIIQNFCTDTNIPVNDLKNEFKTLFSTDWSLALQSENFFGLIAIQVYIAYLMNDDEDYTKGMYNPRLADFLKSDNSTYLNIELLYEKYQDELWLKLKNWCFANGYSIGIPEERKYKGRYIQYPLSQALLNQDDLEHLPYLFDFVGLRYSEILSFSDFSGIIGEQKNNIFLPSHYLKIEERLKKEGNEELLYWQIFEYFCTWDGEIKNIEKQKGKLNYKIQTDKNSLYLSSDKSEFQIIKYGKLSETIDINSNNIFQKISKTYRLPHKEKQLIFFIKDESYGDWEETRFLIPGRTNLIFCKCDNTYEHLIKSIDPKYVLIQNRFYSLFEIEIDKSYRPNSFWKKYFQERTSPFSIQNGLKLDRKIWMYNAGPDIIFDQLVDAWINGKKLEFTEGNLVVRLRYYEIGKYVLRIKEGETIKIEIKNPENNSTECSSGWIINMKSAIWEPAKKDYQISGMTNKFIDDLKVHSEIREWIYENTKKLNKRKNSHTNLITNAIKRSRYGIQY